jgi:tocopherol cyclase
MYSIRKIWHSEIFQGAGKKKRYFEGWYFKIVSANQDFILAVIPGYSAPEDGKGRHFFIQVIDGISRKTEYFTFPNDEFSFSKKEFSIRIGLNTFNSSGIHLSLAGKDFQISGSLDFNNPVHFSGGLLSPGMMGPFSFLPGMECRHDVVSVDHGLSGSLFINRQNISFNGGRGYIEKDWGKSFPSSWIWIQSNHFEIPGTSFMLSAARVPYLAWTFPGFMSLLHLPGGNTLRFATYTGAQIKTIKLSDNTLDIEMAEGHKILRIHASRAGSGELAAPVKGAMDRRIAESITAVIDVELTESGRIIFKGKGSSAGLEIVGNMNELI